MSIGQLVDFCVEYNNRQAQHENKGPTVRRATQKDIDAFFGG